MDPSGRSQAAPATTGANALPSSDDHHDRQRRGTRQLLIARAAFIASGYLVAVIVARGLGPTDYGIYGVLISVLTWLEVLASAGIQGATGKLIPEHQSEVHVVEQSARFVLLTLALTLFAVGWLAAPAIGELFRIPDGAHLFRLAILDLPLASIYISYQGILTGHRLFGPLGVSQTLFGVAKVVGVLVLLGVGLSVASVLVANAAATLAVVIYLFVRHPPAGLWPQRAMVGRLIAIAVPMGTYLLAMQVLLRLDLWSLKRLWNGGGEVIGQYVAALNLARLLTVIPTVQSGVLFASISWALAKNDENAAQGHLLEATRFALLLVAPACVILGAEASSVMGVLFSDAYAAGGRFLLFQLLAFGIYGLLDAFAHSLMAAGERWRIASMLLALIPVVLLGNLLLIPSIGPVGAAVSLLLGVLLGACMLGFLVLRRHRALFRWSSLARVFGAAAVVGLAGGLVAVPDAWVLVKVGVEGALYLLLLWSLGELQATDFGFTRSGAKAASR
jgi:O-antigen/teichoic acid export membrane protein